MRIRTVSELKSLETFEERFRYLSLKGQVGASTFGFDRYINQAFYRSSQWKHIRTQIIARDLGCDLGISGRDIHERAIIHHLNPMSVNDIIDGDDSILNPEYLVMTKHQTHNAIHYGDESLLPRAFVERKRGDTKLW